MNSHDKHRKTNKDKENNPGKEGSQQMIPRTNKYSKIEKTQIDPPQRDEQNTCPDKNITPEEENRKTTITNNSGKHRTQMPKISARSTVDN